MHKQPSKSVIFLLLFDLVVIATSTFFWAKYYQINNLFALSYSFIATLVGFIVLFLKKDIM